MQTDLAPCFTTDELLLAKRLFAARAKRLDIAPGLLLRAAVRDLVFDEAGRGITELTLGAVEAAETRADAAQLARDQAAAAAFAAAEAETVITITDNQEPSA